MSKCPSPSWNLKCFLRVQSSCTAVLAVVFSLRSTDLLPILQWGAPSASWSFSRKSSNCYVIHADKYIGNACIIVIYTHSYLHVRTFINGIRRPSDVGTRTVIVFFLHARVRICAHARTRVLSRAVCVSYVSFTTEQVRFVFLSLPPVTFYQI